MKVFKIILITLFLFSCSTKKMEDYYFVELKSYGENKVELYIQNKTGKIRELDFIYSIKLKDSNEYIVVCKLNDIELLNNEAKKVEGIIIQESFDSIIPNYTVEFKNKAESIKYEIKDNKGLFLEKTYEVK